MKAARKTAATKVLAAINRKMTDISSVAFGCEGDVEPQSGT